MDVKDVNMLALELRSQLERKDADDVIVKGNIQNINERLNKYEDENQRLVKQLAEKQKEELELKEKIENFEKKLHRLPAGAAKDAEKSLESKAFGSFIRYGKDHVMASGEVKYLRTDVNNAGGFLCDPEFISEMLKNITEISPIRQVSRVRTTTRHSIEIPRRTELLQAFWVGEGAPINESQSVYGLETIKVNKLAVYTIATTEMLSDAAFNMEAEIAQDIAERFAQKEGEAFILGDGVEKPEGILFNPEVQEVRSGLADTFNTDSLIKLTGELKAGYNPMFILNRKTIADIRSFKDGNGQYIWGPSIDGSNPGTILGRPYVDAIDMPDIAANSVPVAYADMMRAYNIVDHNDMSMIRDQFTLSTSGKIKFVSMRRTGAQVVMPEAIKKLRVGV